MIRQFLLTGFLLVAGAVVGIWYGPSLVLKTLAVAQWNETVAQVSSVHIEMDSTAADGSAGGDYTLVVHYRYQVEGVEYLGSRYQAAREWKFDQLANAEMESKRLQDQPDITVYVDPEDPSAAVMDQGGAMHSWLTVGFGWAMLLTGLYVYFRQLRPQRRRTAQAGS